MNDIGDDRKMSDAHKSFAMKKCGNAQRREEKENRNEDREKYDDDDDDVEKERTK